MYLGIFQSDSRSSHFQLLVNKAVFMPSILRHFTASMMDWFGIARFCPTNFSKPDITAFFPDYNAIGFNNNLYNLDITILIGHLLIDEMCNACIYILYKNLIYEIKLVISLSPWNLINWLSYRNVFTLSETSLLNFSANSEIVISPRSSWFHAPLSPLSTTVREILPLGRPNFFSYSMLK